MPHRIRHLSASFQLLLPAHDFLDHGVEKVGVCVGCGQDFISLLFVWGKIVGWWWTQQIRDILGTGRSA